MDLIEDCFWEITNTPRETEEETLEALEVLYNLLDREVLDGNIVTEDIGLSVRMKEKTWDGRVWHNAAQELWTWSEADTTPILDKSMDFYDFIALHGEPWMQRKWLKTISIKKLYMDNPR